MTLDVSPCSHCCQRNFPTGTIKVHCIVLYCIVHGRILVSIVCLYVFNTGYSLSTPSLTVDPVCTSCTSPPVEQQNKNTLMQGKVWRNKLRLVHYSFASWPSSTFCPTDTQTFWQCLKDILIDVHCPIGDSMLVGVCFGRLFYNYVNFLKIRGW